MRNLKRTLSLVLAAVMLVGMMVVGAPAASSDFVDGNVLISNDDLTPDAGGIPEKIADRASIAQDLVHMIRESGLLTEMLANRDAGARRLNMIKVTLAVDDDERIVPGTAEITETSLGTYLLTAETVDYGPLSLALEA